MWKVTIFSTKYHSYDETNIPVWYCFIHDQYLKFQFKKSTNSRPLKKEFFCGFPKNYLLSRCKGMVSPRYASAHEPKKKNKNINSKIFCELSTDISFFSEGLYIKDLNSICPVDAEMFHFRYRFTQFVLIFKKNTILSQFQKYYSILAWISYLLVI